MDEAVSDDDSSGPLPRDPKKELQEIVTTCRIIARAHYMSAEDYEHWNEFFGVATVMLGVGSGSAILGSSQAAETSAWLKLLLGLLSISAGIFASLQTFFGFVLDDPPVSRVSLRIRSEAMMNKYSVRITFRIRRGSSVKNDTRTITPIATACKTVSLDEE